MKVCSDSNCSDDPVLLRRLGRGYGIRAGILKFIFGMVACWCCLESQAAISSMTFNVSVPQQEDFSDLPITFQKFDSALGQLSSVEIILQGTGQFTQQFENRANSPNSARVRQTVILSLALADANQPLVSAKQKEAHKYKVGAKDGVLDFGGTSGVTGIYDVTASDDRLLQSKKNLAMFTGSDLAELFLTSESRFHISSGKNASFAVDSLMGANITIIYNYVTVPEPALMGGLAGVLALLCAVRRTKKNA